MKAALSLNDEDVATKCETAGIPSLASDFIKLCLKQNDQAPLSELIQSDWLSTQNAARELGTAAE
jgi:hypothetical protein